MSRENYGMMNQEIRDDEVTIDLMELFSALWAKKTIIILSAIFMALVAFVGTKMFVTPKYTSVTKLYLDILYLLSETWKKNIRDRYDYWYT